MLPEIIPADSTPEPSNYAEARDSLVKTIRLELVGPDNSTDGEDLVRETILSESPLQRYKIGVLYPKTTGGQEAEELEKEAASTAELPQENEEASKALSKNAEEALEKIQAREIREDLPEEESISDLAYSGIQRPASVAISFFIPKSANKASHLKFSLSGGTYDSGEAPYSWVREPISLEAQKTIEELFSKQGSVLLESTGHAAALNIKLKVFVREHRGKGIVVTYSAINETPASIDGERLSNDRRSAFQVQLKAEFLTKDGQEEFGISAYPKPENRENDLEEQSLDLLYRDAETYAVGHGCAAAWPTKSRDSFVTKIWSTPFPEYEIHSITPVLKREDGSRIEISMAALAGLDPQKGGFAAIDELIERYDAWIKSKRQEAAKLHQNFRPAADKNLDLCEESLARMKQGRKFLQEDKKAQLAFELANKAILIQQKRGSDKRRDLIIDEEKLRISFSRPFEDTDSILKRDIPYKGKWRPFQIAFLLLALKSSALGEAPDRDIVDLIWFPTGGGKTEAYFGLAAFSIFYRRLADPEDSGVSALMRYTLRLLTADQFERASGLICALEHIRREDPESLGAQPFSIGIWLGQSTTPNSREEARKNLRELKAQGIKAGNKFLVTKCPWCSAQIGPVRVGRKTEVRGYEQEGNRVKIHCSDQQCDFSDELPIYVVDEDIYESKPTLIIGTVDKFAQVAWDERCRSIFGLDENGQRDVSPPGLIIQDELHLISGPLGSMVGLYETIIEEFCTDHRTGKSVKPKIVCSTATIRRFESQIKALYARPSAKLFPASGIEASDSFFSKWQSHSEERGRKYIGIFAPGESIQTMQVRTMAIALQGALYLPKALRDPYWTLLSFFNSLRELGNTITLFQSDILTRLNIFRRREGLTELRWLNNILELTSRLKNDEIDAVRGDLKVVYPPEEKYSDVIDVCLASNIIEVGVDIPRLSLMTIVGQPKTTAQYIQVSGRVGRTPDKPGLILTIYGASKPRDRSHFEKFTTYHQKLYAQVEPTSVTPFSGPALERALHALIVSYLRQTLPESRLASSWPMPDAEIAYAIKIIKNRVAAIYSDLDDQKYVLADVEEHIDRFLTSWKINQTFMWETKEGQDGLIYRAGAYVTQAVANRSFKTPQSMRNVDLECKGMIAYPLQRKPEE